MRTILSILGVSFVLIAACMFYLMKAGVVMRPEPYVKPTTIHDQIDIIPEHLVIRMFPELQTTHYILWGLDLNDPEQQRTFTLAQQEYAKYFSHSISILNSETTNLAEVEACPFPCWILFPQDGAHGLRENAFIEEYIKPYTESYLSLSWISFTYPKDIPQECIEQKFLDFVCMKWVGLKEAQKRFKDEGQRYFFMRRYMDKDYFIFVREADFQSRPSDT